jgi:hypothetical protein
VLALAIVLAPVIAVVLPTNGGAEPEPVRTKVNVTCRCVDTVGQSFCSAFKDRIQKSVGYQLVDNTNGYGMGVHFACVDMWKGIQDKLSGRMSAVSVSFTIYSDKLPGEILEDSSVFRVGKDAVPEMSQEIVTALGQLVDANSSFFENMRTGGQAPSPQAGPSSGP